ncbi:hypothetical protein EVAR_20860_1 [Eumeta japonica]|uniref:Uncharacterized protein n=1 Tax=Eumeta variegata TaxID=151549 RepID=A0A4C1UDL7_EUMVA|nr:hypothetical protein EVAR_20860_1 [Eumeta japonica]
MDYWSHIVLIIRYRSSSGAAFARCTRYAGAYERLFSFKLCLWRASLQRAAWAGGAVRRILIRRESPPAPASGRDLHMHDLPHINIGGLHTAERRSRVKRVCESPKNRWSPSMDTRNPREVISALPASQIEIGYATEGGVG